MTKQQLIEQIRSKKSFLCVGLDTDIYKIPQHLAKCEDAIFEFNRAIIDATAPYCVAYKPNLAFYEYFGGESWTSLEKTVDYIRSNYPDMFIIADAKRGDIGNTSAMYARAFFHEMNVDAVTVAPYMGEDSVKPFLQYPDKWVILLALTSNQGAFDFQLVEDKAGVPLYQRVLERSKQWGNEEQLMYVVGATKAEMLADVRRIVPHSFLLVPGIGAQGGSLSEVCKYGLTDECGLLVNNSRAIIYADNSEHFAEVAGAKAKEMATQMANELSKINFK